MLAFNEAIATQVRKATVATPKGLNIAAIQKGLDQCLNAPFENLCLGFVSGGVGVSTFAKVDIPANTMLGIFSGVIVDPRDAYREQGPDYTARFIDDLAIAPGKRGGIGRFMAHSFQDCDRLVVQFRENLNDPAYIAGMRGSSETFLDRIAAVGIAGEREENPQFDDIQFKNREVRDAIASANVIRVLVPYKDTHVVALMTCYPIKQHEIVTCNYTQRYWSVKGCHPELLTRMGQVVPHKDYKRAGVLPLFVDNPDVKDRLHISIVRDAFDEDIRDDVPIFFGAINFWISLYVLRDALVAANGAPDYYGRLPLNSFAATLMSSLQQDPANLGKHVDVMLFWQTPLLVDEEMRSDKVVHVEPAKTNVSERHPLAGAYKADVVCRANTGSCYRDLCDFLAPLKKEKGRLRFFPEVCEAVIHDVNDGVFSWLPSEGKAMVRG
ncbi:MAG: hypothetical protein COB66_05380 [Coxiella sp. (in: Bacteria)]|nr:MAG: hypothetical protein COB66_05380 [Coxiella sp. (in: g-proteobacteria)]